MEKYVFEEHFRKLFEELLMINIWEFLKFYLDFATMKSLHFYATIPVLKLIFMFIFN